MRNRTKRRMTSNHSLMGEELVGRSRGCFRSTQASQLIIFRKFLLQINILLHYLPFVLTVSLREMMQYNGRREVTSFQWYCRSSEFRVSLMCFKADTYC